MPVHNNYDTTRFGAQALLTAVAVMGVTNPGAGCVNGALTPDATVWQHAQSIANKTEPIPVLLDCAISLDWIPNRRLGEAMSCTCATRLEAMSFCDWARAPPSICGVSTEQCAERLSRAP